MNWSVRTKLDHCKAEKWKEVSQKVNYKTQLPVASNLWNNGHGQISQSITCSKTGDFDFVRFPVCVCELQKICLNWPLSRGMPTYLELLNVTRVEPNILEIFFFCLYGNVKTNAPFMVSNTISILTCIERTKHSGK